MKKTRPGEFEWLVQEGFAVWLLREARAPGYPASQTNTVSTSDTSAFSWTFPALCSRLCWEEQVWLCLCPEPGWWLFSPFVHFHFIEGEDCLHHLPCLRFGSSSCDVSPGPLYAGLGLQEGLEPGTWLEPLGWTRDLDLGYIPILIPKWYWKEYSVTQALSRTWMIEHLAYVPALRPGMCTCYGRGAHQFQPTIHPLKLLPNAYWFSSM